MPEPQIAVAGLQQPLLDRGVPFGLVTSLVHRPVDEDRHVVIPVEEVGLATGVLDQRLRGVRQTEVVLHQQPHEVALRPVSLARINSSAWSPRGLSDAETAVRAAARRSSRSRTPCRSIIVLQLVAVRQQAVVARPLAPLVRALRVAKILARVRIEVGDLQGRAGGQRQGVRFGL